MSSAATENWFLQERQRWIAEMLHVYGFIRREHIERKFNVTTLTASKDLQQFLADHPDKMTYNSSTKRYERIDQ